MLKINTSTPTSCTTTVHVVAMAAAGSRVGHDCTSRDGGRQPAAGGTRAYRIAPTSGAGGPWPAPVSAACGRAAGSATALAHGIVLVVKTAAQRRASMEARPPAAHKEFEQDARCMINFARPCSDFSASRGVNFASAGAAAPASTGLAGGRRSGHAEWANFQLRLTIIIDKLQ